MRIIVGKYRNRAAKTLSNMKIRPLCPKNKRESIKARLARHVSRGFITLPSSKRLKKVKPIKVAGKPLSKMVIEDR